MENFYIGQDVVAICNHPQGHFKDGDMRIVKGLKMCRCNNLKIDIGIYDVNCRTRCTYCGYLNELGVQWFRSSSFKPLDSLVNISELTDVLNEPIFGIMTKKGS